MSTKEIIFFALVFVVLFASAKGAVMMGPKLKLISTISLLISSVVGALFLFLIYKLAKVAKCKGESFHFELPLSKRCEGFPYMQSSNPKLLKKCADMLSTSQGRHDYAQVNCGTAGFNGRPVHYNYTPESNAMWENERCNPPHPQYNNPCVL